MIISGTHLTSYSYDAPVMLDMHAIRLQPRTGGDQLLRRFDIRITPSPAAKTQTVDAEGNALNLFWFLGQTAQLDVETHFEVETLKTNPFDFIPSQPAAMTPQLPPDEREILRPCLSKAIVAPDIENLAQQLAQSSDGSAFSYVLAANRWLYENLSVTVRRHGPPRMPEITLSERKGACRDFALLLMALCRVQGIPARFVSGYHLKKGPDTTGNDLHAWTEVWIPGGGWRGFDPTLGLAVAEHHIAVAASASAALAAPVTGSFHGNVVARLPSHTITLKVL